MVIDVACDETLASAAAGTVAGSLAAAFADARAGLDEVGDGGCLVFRYVGGPGVRSGLTSLTRTLALEWAPRGIRVNAVAGSAAETAELVRLLASPASRMLTGAVIDAP